LVAAQVALIKAALVDESNEIFVFLPHDSVPFVPLEATLNTLLARRSPAPEDGPWTRICLAGVRRLEMPRDCPHAIEPHWGRSLLFKHHQWLALSRTHAERLGNENAMKVARALFEEWYLGEPLCSDEVLPLIALAIPEEMVVMGTNRHFLRSPPQLNELPLFWNGAARGLRAFEEQLWAMGASTECITYAPWMGCHLRSEGHGKQTKSPVVGGGLAPADRDKLIGQLSGMGILFGRKLGVGGGSAVAHNKLIEANVPSSSALQRAPRRLLREEGAAIDDWSVVGVIEHWPTWLQWSISTLEALVPVPVQVILGAALGAGFGYLALIGGGISITVFQRLLSAYIFVHMVIFFLSIALHDEYSFLEPFRDVPGDDRIEI